MVNKAKIKGSRREYQMRDWFKSLGFRAKRVILSGALGGKLLGLSKKEDVSLQKVLPLAALAVPAAASLASGMMGGGKKSDDKEDDEAIQKVVGKLISGVGQKVQGLGLQEDDEEKEELQKHRGKSFHSHKRKSPFSSRRRR